VISLGDARNYYLSTAKNELGVVSALGRAGKPMVPLSWQQMMCPVTHIKEFRKVAKVDLLAAVASSSSSDISSASAAASSSSSSSSSSSASSAAPGGSTRSSGNSSSEMNVDEDDGDK
jgi:hypothetical protein